MCVSRSRMVIGRLAGTIVDAPSPFRHRHRGLGERRDEAADRIGRAPILPFLHQRQHRDAGDRLGLRRDAEDACRSPCAGRLPCRSSRPRARRPAGRPAAPAPPRRRSGSRRRTAAAACRCAPSRSGANAFALGAAGADVGGRAAAACCACTIAGTASQEKKEILV